jgi:peptide deformylase
MSVRPLRYLGDPILRTPSDQVTRFDAGLASLIEDLLDTVQEPGRAGLAANQIGSSLAAFSYNVDGQLHETDHLKGELFIDGLDEDERRRVMRQIYADQIAGGPYAPARPSE